MKVVSLSAAAKMVGAKLWPRMTAAGVTLPYANLAVDEGTAKRMGADAAGIYLSASYVTGIPMPVDGGAIAQ